MLLIVVVVLGKLLSSFLLLLLSIFLSIIIISIHIISFLCHLFHLWWTNKFHLSKNKRIPYNYVLLHSLNQRDKIFQCIQCYFFPWPPAPRPVVPCITTSGLQDQLLGIVVAEERPDLEDSKNQLIVSNAQMKQELKEIEDKILHLLSASQGSPVDDIELIETLDASKITSGEIQVSHQVITQEIQVGHQVITQEIQVGHQVITIVIQVSHQAITQEIQVGHQVITQEIQVTHQAITLEIQLVIRLLH